MTNRTQHRLDTVPLCCQAGLMNTTEAPITSVWSAYGHRFMWSDVDDYESCLTCGALYKLVPLADDPTRGDYCAANGDAPHDCTHDTGMSHGYPGEREPAQDHDCNCLFCA